MWSINLFMNKVLKAVEETENRFNFFDSYTIPRLSNKDQRTSVSSHFVEVSLAFRLLSMPFDMLYF